MKNISFFCLTLEPKHEEIIKRLSYIPVGLGTKNFSSNCFTDKKGINISKKNPYYGEYTFHYWLWKNYLDQINTDWVGFCQYRKFFIKKDILNNDLHLNELKNIIITNINEEDYRYDCILGSPFSVKNYKVSKIFKNHLVQFLLNPSLIFNKEKRNLKFHFDLFHGKGNLDIAINLLDKKNRDGFKNFMSQNNSFNPHNMFICKKDILLEYYSLIFPWLEKCESKFGLNNLEGYGMKRIYGFLAERFLSYWFLKNFKVKEHKILIKDLSDYKNL